MNPSNNPQWPDEAVYNPDTNDFTITYALDETGPKPYTVKAGDHASFPKPIADHIKQHLAKHLVFKRGIKQNFEDDLKEALQEVSYDLY